MAAVAPFLEPLLRTLHSQDGLDAGLPTFGVRAGTLNLCKAVLGAGLLSLPRAFSLLGAGFSTLAYLLVSVLTIFTLGHGMVIPSASARGTQLEHGSYAGLARHFLGPFAEQGLAFMVVMGCLGFQTSYLDIISDLLFGSYHRPEEGLLSAPFPTADRNLVLGLIVLLVLLPLGLHRHMGNLSMMNGVGLVSMAVFATTLLALAVTAMWTGQAYNLPLTPNLEALGSRPLLQGLGGFHVLSVLLTSCGCHQNMHPLMDEVEPFSTRTLQLIIRNTVAITTTFYYVASVCACIAFGPHISDDILTNLTVPSMQPIVGEATATVLAAAVKWGFLLNICGSVVLTLFPMRQALADLLTGSQGAPPIIDDGPLALSVEHASVIIGPGLHARTWREKAHAPMTVGILGLAYLLAASFPSIWMVLSLVGSVSVTFVCWITPSMIALSKMRQGEQGGLWHSSAKLLCWAIAALGAAVFVNGFVVLYFH